MKVYIVQNVARQVEGDLMMVQVEKGFQDRKEAENHLATLPRQKTEMLKTEMGEIECFCVRGIYEIEVTTNFDIDVPEISRKDTAKLMEAERFPPASQQFTPEEIAKIQRLLKAT